METRANKLNQPLEDEITSYDIDTRRWGMLAHIITLVGNVLPMANIIAPLVILLTKGQESKDIKIHAKESLNFQISMLIYMAIAGVLSFILIGIPIVMALTVVQVILSIMAGIKAYEGKVYRYPITMRFLR